MDGSPEAVQSAGNFWRSLETQAVDVCLVCIGGARAFPVWVLSSLQSSRIIRIIT